MAQEDPSSTYRVGWIVCPTRVFLPFALLSLIIFSGCGLTFHGYECRTNQDCKGQLQCHLGFCKLLDFTLPEIDSPYLQPSDRTPEPSSEVSDTESTNTGESNQHGGDAGSSDAGSTFPESVLVETNRDIVDQDPRNRSCSETERCPTHYTCVRNRCMYNARTEQWCEKLEDILEKRHLTCSFKIRCLHEDTSKCSEQEKILFKSYLSCVRGANVCADAQLGFVERCWKDAGLRSRSGCGFSVEVKDNTERIHGVSGTTRCDKRHVTGAQGQVPVRLFLHSLRGSTLDLDKLLSEQKSFKPNDFSIQGVRVLDALDGRETELSAALQVVHSPVQVFVNPHAQRTKTQLPGHHDPRLFQLLLEMSKTAVKQDIYQDRIEGIKTWLFEYLDHGRGNRYSDLLSMIQFKDHFVKDSDFSFKQRNNQYLGPDKKRRGFLKLTTQELKSLWHYFSQAPNFKASGDAPLYDALFHGLENLRAVAKLNGKLTFNPALFAMTSSRDVSLTNSKMPPAYKRILSQVHGLIRGRDFDDFVPVMFIAQPRQVSIDPKKDQILEKHSKQHLDLLCSLARSAMGPSGEHWGQVFHIPPHMRDSVTVYNALTSASHAMNGFVTLDLRYQILNAKKGKRYIVEFHMDLTKSGISSGKTFPIWFEVTP